MDDDRFNRLMEAQQAEIDRRDPEAVFVHEYWTVGEILFGNLLTPAGVTCLITCLSPEGAIEHAWAEEAVKYYYARFLTAFKHWMDPTEGAVSPALSAFFAWCDEDQPPVLHWARWLRTKHEYDAGDKFLDPRVAEVFVEVMLRQDAALDLTIGDDMRRAVRGEPLGERDPNQLNLFPGA